MRYYVIIFLCLFVCLPPVFAGSFQNPSYHLTWGDGPLTSGFDAAFQFKKENSKIFLNFQGNHQRFNATYGVDLGWLAAGPSVGVFKGVPWVGALANITLNHVPVLSQIKLSHWSGYEFYKEKNGLLEPGNKFRMFFFYNGISTTIGGWNISYSAMPIHDETPVRMVTIGRSFPLNKKITMTGEVTYDLKNEKPLIIAGFKGQL